MLGLIIGTKQENLELLYEAAEKVMLESSFQNGNIDCRPQKATPLSYHTRQNQR